MFSIVFSRLKKLFHLLQLYWIQLQPCLPPSVLWTQTLHPPPYRHSGDEIMSEQFYACIKIIINHHLCYLIYVKPSPSSKAPTPPHLRHPKLSTSSTRHHIPSECNLCMEVPDQNHPAKKNYKHTFSQKRVNSENALMQRKSQDQAVTWLRSYIPLSRSKH